MVNIDYIMELLDWNNSAEKQELGIRLAGEVKCINVFLQPCKPYGKNVWGNCAKILSKKTNEELSVYSTELMMWLQDMNWPGAFCIFDRLKLMVDEQNFRISYRYCMKLARALEDESWELALHMLVDDDFDGFSDDHTS